MIVFIIWNPFFGSGAVLFGRPDYDPQRHVESINDLDGHIANVWRAIRFDPEAVAWWCDWPVNHDDLRARKKVLNDEAPALQRRFQTDPMYFDAKLAGYYIWGAGCWIGSGLICPNQIPHLSHGGKGVHAKGLRDDEPATDIHAPYNGNIYAWLRRLSERLRYVRVVCGDWSQLCGGDWQDKPGSPVGIFFDSPYGDAAERDPRLYSVDSEHIAHDVREWCRGRADRKNYRIVLAGYYEEHESLLAEGWSVYRWRACGGYANVGNGKGSENCHREALFLSPHCLPLGRRNGQMGLFE